MSSRQSHRTVGSLPMMRMSASVPVSRLLLLLCVLFLLFVCSLAGAPSRSDRNPAVPAGSVVRASGEREGKKTRFHSMDSPRDAKDNADANDENFEPDSDDSNPTITKRPKSGNDKRRKLKKQIDAAADTDDKKKLAADDGIDADDKVARPPPSKPKAGLTPKPGKKPSVSPNQPKEQQSESSPDSVSQNRNSARTDQRNRTPKDAEKDGDDFEGGKEKSRSANQFPKNQTPLDDTKSEAALTALKQKTNPTPRPAKKASPQKQPTLPDEEEKEEAEEEDEKAEQAETQKHQEEEDEPVENAAEISQPGSTELEEGEETNKRDDNENGKESTDETKYDENDTNKEGNSRSDKKVVEGDESKGNAATKKREPRKNSDSASQQNPDDDDENGTKKSRRSPAERNGEADGEVDEKTEGKTDEKDDGNADGEADGEADEDIQEDDKDSSPDQQPDKASQKVGGTDGEEDETHSQEQDGAHENDKTEPDADEKDTDNEKGSGDNVNVDADTDEIDTDAKKKKKPDVTMQDQKNAEDDPDKVLQNDAAMNDGRHGGSDGENKLSKIGHGKADQPQESAERKEDAKKDKPSKDFDTNEEAKTDNREADDVEDEEHGKGDHAGKAVENSGSKTGNDGKPKEDSAGANSATEQSGDGQKPDGEVQSAVSPNKEAEGVFAAAELAAAAAAAAADKQAKNGESGRSPVVDASGTIDENGLLDHGNEHGNDPLFLQKPAGPQPQPHQQESAGNGDGGGENNANRNNDNDENELQDKCAAKNFRVLAPEDGVARAGSALEVSFLRSQCPDMTYSLEVAFDNDFIQESLLFYKTIKSPQTDENEEVSMSFPDARDETASDSFILPGEKYFVRLQWGDTRDKSLVESVTVPVPDAEADFAVRLRVKVLTHAQLKQLYSDDELADVFRAEFARLFGISEDRIINTQKRAADQDVWPIIKPATGNEPSPAKVALAAYKIFVKQLIKREEAKKRGAEESEAHADPQVDTNADARALVVLEQFDKLIRVDLMWLCVSGKYEVDCKKPGADDEVIKSEKSWLSLPESYINYAAAAAIIAVGIYGFFFFKKSSSSAGVYGPLSTDDADAAEDSGAVDLTAVKKGASSMLTGMDTDNSDVEPEDIKNKTALSANAGDDGDDGTYLEGLLRPRDGDANGALLFTEIVLGRLGIPKYGMPKYLKPLEENYLTTIDQLYAMDTYDWKRLGLPSVIEGEIRKALTQRAQALQTGSGGSGKGNNKRAGGLQLKVQSKSAPASTSNPSAVTAGSSPSHSHSHIHATAPGGATVIDVPALTAALDGIEKEEKTKERGSRAKSDKKKRPAVAAISDDEEDDENREDDDDAESDPFHSLGSNKSAAAATSTASGAGSHRTRDNKRATSAAASSSDGWGDLELGESKAEKKSSKKDSSKAIIAALDDDENDEQDGWDKF